MTKKITLNTLRREIDAIDNSIHDLIMRRTEVVKGVRELKRDDEIKIRPAREAKMIRRLLARHRGPFPKREMVRIWRELIVATLSFEGPFSVAVHDPGEGKGLWDLARDQFGSFTPMKGYTSTRMVVDTVHRRQATLGILPVIDGDEGSWWKHIALIDKDAPMITARLPFAGPGNGPGKDMEALVICPVPQEPTGCDRSLFVFETIPDVLPEQIKTKLADSDIDCGLVVRWHDNTQTEGALYLIEINDFITGDDDRLKKFQGALGTALMRTVPIGGYAIPLSDDELATVKTGNGHE